MRRSLFEEASRHHLLLHTGQLEAVTCPATIMHRWGGRNAVQVRSVGGAPVLACAHGS